MPHVSFTSHLQQHVDCPPADVAGTTVMESLEAVFVKNPRLRGYVLDERKRLRQHVIIFIDGRPIVDRERLGDAVESTSEIYVMQALSGG